MKKFISLSILLVTLIGFNATAYISGNNHYGQITQVAVFSDNWRSTYTDVRATALAQVKVEGQGKTDYYYIKNDGSGKNLLALALYAKSNNQWVSVYFTDGVIDYFSSND